MKTLDRYLGVALSGSYLAYCLVVADVMRKAGAVSLRCAPGEHAGRIAEAFKMLRSSMLQGDPPDPPADAAQVCFVGMRGDYATPRSEVAARRAYNRCRVRTIVECQSDAIFGYATHPTAHEPQKQAPHLQGTRAVPNRRYGGVVAHPCQPGRITNEKIPDTDSLIKCARKRFTSLGSLDAAQFSGIAVAWATAVCLKRRLEVESMKLDGAFMQAVEAKVKRDRVVVELAATLEREKDPAVGDEQHALLRGVQLQVHQELGLLDSQVPPDRRRPLRNVRLLLRLRAPQPLEVLQRHPEQRRRLVQVLPDARRVAELPRPDVNLLPRVQNRVLRGRLLPGRPLLDPEQALLHLDRVHVVGRLYEDAIDVVAAVPERVEDLHVAVAYPVRHPVYGLPVVRHDGAHLQVVEVEERALGEDRQVLEVRARARRHHAVAVLELGQLVYLLRLQVQQVDEPLQAVQGHQGAPQRLLQVEARHVDLDDGVSYLVLDRPHLPRDQVKPGEAKGRRALLEVRHQQLRVGDKVHRVHRNLPQLRLPRAQLQVLHVEPQHPQLLLVRYGDEAGVRRHLRRHHLPSILFELDGGQLVRHLVLVLRVPRHVPQVAVVAVPAQRQRLVPAHDHRRAHPAGYVEQYEVGPRPFAVLVLQPPRDGEYPVAAAADDAVVVRVYCEAPHVPLVVVLDSVRAPPCGRVLLHVAPFVVRVHCDLRVHASREERVAVRPHRQTEHVGTMLREHLVHRARFHVPQYHVACRVPTRQQSVLRDVRQCPHLRLLLIRGASRLFPTFLSVISHVAIFT
ncbi:beta-ACP synthase, putative [Babesia caballi]|uniref:Beta-ACP synthase, putative n=1 Tax=Babesia caballi TaxID=5871 RepID=A0AAV4LLB6_BABCB|nr:beta-ACP synthase, putative [Babesia caballi]